MQYRVQHRNIRIVGSADEIKMGRIAHEDYEPLRCFFNVKDWWDSAVLNST